MRRPLAISTTAIALLTGLLTGLVAACAPADPTPGALPLGIGTARVPLVDANAYVYVSAPSALAFTSDRLGIDALAVASAEVLVRTAGREFATRLTFADAPANPPTAPDGEWWFEDNRSLRFGPNSPWGVLVREAWEQDARRPFADQFPGAWADLQALPAEPPATPVAAGFVRNFGELIASLIAPAGASIPSLADGLALVRVDRVVFAAYATDLQTLPNGVAPGILTRHGLSVLAVAQSAYPGAVVGQVFGGFVSALGLTPLAIGEVTAHARELAPGLHVVVLQTDASIYFALGAAQANAEALIRAVALDQAARE